VERSDSDPDAPPDLFARRQIADEVCPSVTGPYFYRVEKAGKVSHLLGTRHIGVPLAKFPPVVAERLDAAKLAVFETAPDDELELPDPPITVREALGPELWARYEALTGTAIAGALERGSPAAALVMLTSLYEDISARLDGELEDRAVARGIPTAGLEPSQLQGELIAKHLGLRALRSVIDHTADRAELERETREDLAEYCAGTDDTPFDADEREEMRASGYTEAEIAEFEEELVYARNARWIPALEKLFAKGDVFVAVGAGHLPGERGVLALLARRGYSITRITR